MNEEEFKLWDSVNQCFAKNSVIKIVNSRSGARTVKDKFMMRGFNRVLAVDVDGFYEYGKLYLEVGA